MAEGTGGASLIQQTLLELSREDDNQDVHAAEWDANLAELSVAVKTRIPQSVEERCRGARHRTDCGIIPAVRHAWVSADALLHIWDYRCEDPQVHVVPADSIIVSVAACPPRPGVFESGVQLLIVLCTRLTVSLIGLFLPRQSQLTRPLLTRPAADPLRMLAAPAAAGALGASPSGGAPGAAAGLFPVGTAAPPQAAQRQQGLLPGSDEAAPRGRRTDNIQLVSLEGYSARTDGALFHSVRHTSDGHILLICGAPQVYELAYSRSPGWFHSKCRLIRHPMGLWPKVRDFLAISTLASGRIRLLECAHHDYAVTVDDASTLRLLQIRDQAVHRAESVAMLEELARLTINELSNQCFSVAKARVASRTITHAFLRIGLDGHLRAHVVTAAHERLLFVCSACAAGEPAGASAARETRDGAQPARRYGFWLQHVSEARLGQGGGGAQSGSLAMWPGGGAAEAPGTAAHRRSCLEEAHEPCLYASGVWIAAARRHGATATELGITARVDEPGCGSGGGAARTPGTGARSLHKALTLDSAVMDIAEEGGAEGPDALSAACGLITGRSGGPPNEPEPAAFHATRSFVLFLQNHVQVFRLSLKPQPLARPPATPAECCQHLAQLTLPPAAAQADGAAAAARAAWVWSFDDVAAPTPEEQQQAMEAKKTVPPVPLGRWTQGLLRFLAVVLRPVWELALVTPIQGRHFVDFHKHEAQGLSLALGEDAIRRVLAHLRPAVRFARQGLGAPAPPAGAARQLTAAARARMYTCQRTAEGDRLVQAQAQLRRILDVAERVQQVLGLLSVLHLQRNAYRVLQSRIVAGPALEALLTKPLGTLVAGREALAPVVRLCTALVVESGLTTPAAAAAGGSAKAPAPFPGLGGNGFGGGAGKRGSALDGSLVGCEVCKELEEQCPAIFAEVDLGHVRARLGAAGQGEVGSSNELLRRYVQCVGSGSVDDHWESLARSVQVRAAQDPYGAAEVCIEKLQQLQQARGDAPPGGGGGGGPPAAPDRAKLLLDALFGAVGADAGAGASQGLQARALVEHLLVKTGSLRFACEDPHLQAAGGMSIVHAAILDHLLARAPLHPILEALWDSSAADVEGFLKARCAGSQAAGEILWKRYLQRGRPACASRVLLQLAERPDGGCGLHERVQYLNLAHQAAGRALPQSKEAFDRLAARLDVAARVQVPLHHELELIAKDGRISAQWRSAAEQRRGELQQLVDLQTLRRAVTDFSLFHIGLVIADLESSIQGKESLMLTWVGVFFPPTMSPYSPSQMSTEPAIRSHSIFPLLMVRRCAAFFARNERAPSLPEATVVCAEDLHLRATQLLDELAVATQAPDALWDVRCVAPLLEYCNCLWLRASEGSGGGCTPPETAASAGPEPGGEPVDGAGGGGDRPGSGLGYRGDTERAWIALRVLPRRPFHFAPEGLVKLYFEISVNVDMWVPDLQAKLPADPGKCRPAIAKGDVFVHLCEVFMVVLGLWVAKVESSHSDEHARGSFSSAWPVTETCLATLRSRLGDMGTEAPHGASAARLAREGQRLEGAGRRLCGQSVPPEMA